MQVISWSRLMGTNTSYLATGTVVMVQDQRVSLNSSLPADADPALKWDGIGTGWISMRGKVEPH